MKIDIDKEVIYLKGVGEKRAVQLKKLGIIRVNDLITHFPRLYEERNNIKTIGEFMLGENVLFKAKIMNKIVTRRARGKLVVSSFFVGDKTGTIKIVVFNQQFLVNALKEGEEYAFYGKVEGNILRFEMHNPEIVSANKMEIISGIKPIYPLTKGITNNYIISLMRPLINESLELDDIFTNEFLSKYGLYDINKAMNEIHFPNNLSEINKARHRHIFEELYLYQLALMSIRLKQEKQTKVPMKNIDILELLKLLTFELTTAQKNTIKEITEDLSSDKVMNRLVQGDVGSGKTIVAAIAMYVAVRNGYQAAIMAPTTILATQHYEDLKPMYDKLGIKTQIITGKTTKKQKSEINKLLLNGEVDILFGTHAIIEEDVEFSKMGLVITDEQHRFGVRHRMELAKKGEKVNTLVMSATPIPRTLAMTMYSDLDLSIMDELPAGRKPIKTNAVYVNESMEERINTFISKELNKGRQAYVVCPLIEENEDLDLTAATSLYEKYKEETFVNYNVGFLNGKMKNKEKDEIMTKFKNKKIDLLVSTTVIEVGVNVPNATIMVVEDSERFGLASLHQLRGRVGRGSYESFCILKTKIQAVNSMKRLKIMESSNDGFKIAEQDLELRGPGDFFGTRQHGLPEFKLADLMKDMTTLKLAMEAAKDTIKDDPMLRKLENQKLSNEFKRRFKEQLEYAN